MQLEQSDMSRALNMAEMAKQGSSRAAIKKTQLMIKTRCTEVRAEKKPNVEFPRHRNVRLQWNDTWQWFAKIRLTAAFCAKMAQQTIRRHNGGIEKQLHLLQTRRHICPDRHLCRPVTMMQLKVPKSNVCHLEMCIYMLLFPMLIFSFLMHMPRIARTIKIVFQIC